MCHVNISITNYFVGCYYYRNGVGQILGVGSEKVD